MGVKRGWHEKLSLKLIIVLKIHMKKIYNPIDCVYEEGGEK